MLQARARLFVAGARITARNLDDLVGNIICCPFCYTPNKTTDVTNVPRIARASSCLYSSAFFTDNTTPQLYRTTLSVARYRFLLPVDTPATLPQLRAPRIRFVASTRAKPFQKPSLT